MWELLRKSINGVISDEAFRERIIPILETLDFIVSDEDHVFQDGDDDEDYDDGTSDDNVSFPVFHHQRIPLTHTARPWK